MAQATARPPSDELDEVTLRRAQRGEEAAFRRLVECYQALVFRFLSRALTAYPADVVEDVAQDTFLHVFTALPRFSLGGTARLSTWILTIASRRAIDTMRKSGPVKTPLRLDLVAPERADTRVLHDEVARLTQQVLLELSPELRTAFVLRALFGFEYSKIARVLDIEIGTVKSRLHRARSRLAERLEEARRG